MKALDEIRERWEKTTPGPWRIDEHDTTPFESIVSTAKDEPWGWVEVARSLEPDAEFIAHAPSDVSRLLTAVQDVLAYGVDRENHTNTGSAEADAAIRSYAYHVRRLVSAALAEGTR